MDQVFCRIRKECVTANPEELVRQKLLDLMIGDLGFPEGLIVLEKALQQMPHLSLKEQKVPDRRADIICYGKGIHHHYGLYPLLLVECKAVKLNSKVITQVSGYNHFLKAYFICVANQHEMRTGWYDLNQKQYIFVNYLPKYQQLLESITRIEKS